MLEKLDRDMRLRLLRVVAAVAWVDGEVHASERAFVQRLIERMKLSADETRIALGYLDKAPHPAECNPMSVPPDYREEVAKLARELVASDGATSDEEAECLEMLETVLLGR